MSGQPDRTGTMDPVSSKSPAVEGTRYALAVEAIAADIAAELARDDLRAEAAWDRAGEAFERHRAGGPHRWVFEGIEPLELSANVFDALEELPDGSTAWIQGSVASAAAAVVRFDVFSRLAEDPRMEVG